MGPDFDEECFLGVSIEEEESGQSCSDKAADVWHKIVQLIETSGISCCWRGLSESNGPIEVIYDFEATWSKQIRDGGDILGGNILIRHDADISVYLILSNFRNGIKA